MYSSNNSSGSIIAAGIIIVIFLFGFCVCKRFMEIEKQNATWNYGVCERCHEGKLKFKNATSAYGSKDKFYYECNKCSHVQFFYKIME